MSKTIAVTITGSFKEDAVNFGKLYKYIEAKYTVLSPASIDWVNPGEEFVKVCSDRNQTINDIEERHLDSIRRSDFVVLFAPNGYVGVSGAFEVGFAHALGIPVVSDQEVSDQTVKAMIDGIFETDTANVDYGRGLKALQLQYSKIAKRNGWDAETASDTMLLLTEEIGELARAIRKHKGLKRDSKFNVELSEEIADVQIYLAHLANTVNIDLGDAVTDKINKNQLKKIKFRSRTTRGCRERGRSFNAEN